MEPIPQILRGAIREGRTVLLEHELLAIFQSLGCPVPAHQMIEVESIGHPQVRADLRGRPGVLKVVSPAILHKSDVGGIRFLDDVRPDTVAECGREMLAGLPENLAGGLHGFLLEERIAYQPGVGRELLMGTRYSSEFGSIFTIGFGGTYVEALDAVLAGGQGTVVLHPTLTPCEIADQKLAGSLFFRWISGQIRGVEALTPPDELRGELDRWMKAFDRLRQEVEGQGFRLEECEVNPLVWAGRWLPVDALLRLGPPVEPRPAFVLDNLRRAIHPRSVAIVGVSTRMNIGRIILRSMLDAGFPPHRLFPVRSDQAEIDGLRSVPDLSHLPEPVDLLVLAISAATVPEVLREAVATGAARSILLISGGMGETEGGRSIEQRVTDIVGSVEAPKRPVLIGNNSLGLVSQADRVDTLFIPKEKLPRIRTGLHNVALISQSGAYMITRVSKLDYLSPAYQISVGNQLDARFSDFVEVVREDPQIHTFALYLEGLRSGDGERLGHIVSTLVAEGRDVILYKAGRSSLGQAATAGHTASVAGDYRLFSELMADAGAVVAEDFWEFLHLVMLSATLQHKTPAGKRLAMMSNAGFEAVGMADNHRGPDYALQPAHFSQATRQRLTEILVQARIDHLVTLTNPLDITPMANDETHEACIRAIMEDPGVDVGVFCNVPLTPNVQSLPPGLLARDVFDSEQGYARRVIELSRQTSKPMIFVLDAGRHYDLMFRFMHQHGLPVFRSADQAVRILGRYLQARTGRHRSSRG